MSSDDDFEDERQLPPEIPEHLIPNEYKPDKWAQQRLPKPPLRALKQKGDALRASIRTGRTIDYGDIHERYVDLWQEARMVVWRAKHSKAGVKTWDPVVGKNVQSFICDEKLILSAIDTTRGVLDSLIKLRKEIGAEGAGIPGWAIARIEKALRSHPAALKELMRELATEEEKLADEA
jgi:hypothetical protein